jgi:hypothetical protein
MTPAEGITKLGFRQWYERELIEGHAYLVTSFMSLILTAACVEQLDWRGPIAYAALTLGAVLLGAALCLGALRRYSFMLARAECFGAQSSCGQCAVYGLLQVTAADSAAATPSLLNPADNTWIRVRCKRCGHEWRMDNE